MRDLQTIQKTFRVFHKHNTDVVLEEIIAWAKEAVAQLEKAEARLLGVALNGVKESGTHYYYSRYYSDGLRKRRKKRLTLFERIGFKKKKRK